MKTKWLSSSTGIRSDNRPEFIAQAIRRHGQRAGLDMLYIEPGAPWENGCAESFLNRLRDELLNVEEFVSHRRQHATSVHHLQYRAPDFIRLFVLDECLQMVALHANFAPDGYFEGAAVRQATLSREHRDSRDVINARVRFAGGCRSNLELYGRVLDAIVESVGKRPDRFEPRLKKKDSNRVIAS